MLCVREKERERETVSVKECVKLSCSSRFQCAFTACVCIFKAVTLALANQGNYFENANACNNRTLKTTVASHLLYTLKNLPCFDQS